MTKDQIYVLAFVTAVALLTAAIIYARGISPQSEPINNFAAS